MSECFLYLSFVFSKSVKQCKIVITNILIIFNLPVNSTNSMIILYNHNKLKERKRTNNLKEMILKKGGVFSNSN
jgi:hypothetical protein